MKLVLVVIALLLSACVNNSNGGPATQLQSIIAGHKIATWKYNAKGAYSIIFDDYCVEGAQGIQDHAAPEADQRGLVIGFGIVTGVCDEHEWQRAREMIAAGHEAINHSHTHRCAEFHDPWCTEVWSDAEVQAEIDQPMELIYTHTGVRPTFFIFPFDVFTPAKVEHLRKSGYLGARVGEKQQLTDANFTDPFFHLHFDVKFPAESAQHQKYGLNEYVDKAIAEGQLAFREVHGVADQSWGVLSLEELRNHFDYVQARVESYELWMETISNIIKYNQARQLCKLESGVDDTGTWISLSGEFPVCRHGIELSLIFTDTHQFQLTDTQGQLVSQINGTYTLRTGEIYRITGG